MIDDIIRHNASALFNGVDIRDAYAFKVTRDAELNLTDDFAGTLTAQLERRLAVRDFGFATRLLHDASMPERMLHKIIKTLKLSDASIMAGGRYHNLRDLFSFPKVNSKFFYEEMPPIPVQLAPETTLFDTIDQGDMMVHTPVSELRFNPSLFCRGSNRFNRRKNICYAVSRRRGLGDRTNAYCRREEREESNCGCRVESALR